MARVYVSSTYAVISLISLVAMFSFLVINPFLDWTIILNTPRDMFSELKTLASVVFIIFCVQFVLQLLLTILIANQEPAKSSFISLLGSTLALILVIGLETLSPGSLIYLALALGLAPVLVLLISSILLFRRSYRSYTPKLRFVRLYDAKALLNLGIKFFVIQISALVLFQTDNVIITQLFGPAEVSTFNIAYKLFSVIILAFMIIVTPLWSAFTDAYARGDLSWIKNTLISMQKVRAWLTIATLGLLVFSPFIFKLWIGEAVTIQISLSISMTAYVLIFMWNTTYVYFLNGIGKIKLQLYLAIIAGVINIPLSIFLGKIIGLPGISIANTLIIGIMTIFYKIQTNKILKSNAFGIWNK